MIEPTDQDIAEALRLQGWVTKGESLLPHIRSQPQNFPSIMAHAQTIAKLRVATEALDAAHETMHQTTAVLTATDCADVAKTMAVVRQTLTKIKDQTHG